MPAIPAFGRRIHRRILRPNLVWRRIEDNILQRLLAVDNTARAERMLEYEHGHKHKLAIVYVLALRRPPPRIPADMSADIPVDSPTDMPVDMLVD